MLRNGLATQVEITIAQANILARILVRIDLQRQHVGRCLDGEFDDLHLDMAGRQRVVNGFGGTLDDLARNRHNRFQPRPLGNRKNVAGHVDDALRQAEMIAHIDEQQIAVVAFAVDPTRQADRFPGMGFAQFAAIMRSERMHRHVP